MTVTDIESMTPHIDRDWREAFILELRLVDLPGDRIGDALATVDAHCAESGENAADAFGDPTAYARSVAESGPRQRAGGIDARVVAGCLAGLLAVLVTPVVTAAVLTGEPVPVTTGQLGAAVLAVLATALLLARPEPVLRVIAGMRPVTGALAGGVLVLVLVVPLVVLQQVVLSLGWLVPALVVLAGLAVSVLALTATADPVRDPRDGRSTPRDPWHALAAWPFPIASVVLVALTWALHAWS